MLRNIDIDLTYQPTIPGPPPTAGNLYQNACAGDGVTVDTWRSTWIENYGKAKERFGSFDDKSFGQLFGANRHKPAICIASGPSLRHSLDALKDNKKSAHPVMTISTLHNFGLLEDEGCHADYYLSLDSGGVVIDDVTEARNQDGGFYWDKTQGKTLIAYVASDPRLFELWQGDIYLFNCLIPDPGIQKETKAIEPFAHYISSGGNAGGAVMYTAKCVMGSSAIMYVGYDMCFDYDNKFHTYKTHYDAVGEYVPWPDVYGNQRKTWQSYLNFKFWFDHIACNVPGLWINCSEGILGSYREGNIAQYQYKSLKDALLPYQMADTVFLQKVGSPPDAPRDRLDLAELFKNPKYENDLVLF